MGKGYTIFTELINAGAQRYRAVQCLPPWFANARGARCPADAQKLRRGPGTRLLAWRLTSLPPAMS